jgi:hypothetical protein
MLICPFTVLRSSLLLKKWVPGTAVLLIRITLMRTYYPVADPDADPVPDLAYHFDVDPDADPAFFLCGCG